MIRSTRISVILLAAGFLLAQQQVVHGFFNFPEIKMPQFVMPRIQIPHVEIPEIKIPEIKIPEINVPGFWDNFSSYSGTYQVNGVSVIVNNNKYLSTEGDGQNVKIQQAVIDNNGQARRVETEHNIDNNILYTTIRIYYNNNPQNVKEYRYSYNLDNPSAQPTAY